MEQEPRELLLTKVKATSKKASPEKELACSFSWKRINRSAL